MTTVKWAKFVLVGSLAAIMTACANPADDKPMAVAGDAVDTPAAKVAEGAAIYAIADASSLSWIGSKVTGKHDGGFHVFSGTVAVPDGDLEQASIHIDIDVTSIWSDNDRLTNHLKSADFFEVDTYPSAAFQSSRISKAGDGFEVTGNLTLHGVTKSITFPAEITVSDDILTANAEFAIDRRDFEINYDGRADDLIRDEVVIKFDIIAATS